MSGIWQSKRGRAVGALALCGAILLQQDRPASATLAPVKRDDMIAFAKRMAEYQWTATAANLHADCVTKYHSHFHENQLVTGVAYDWGGDDDIAAFQAKLNRGFAAGSHQSEGNTSCTAGIDCSGLVSRAWRQSKRGTAQLSQVADPIVDDALTKMKPGDALNREGHHVVLFESYASDGGINVYEARGGSDSRVIYSRSQDWSYFPLNGKNRFVPIRYKNAID